MPAGRDPGVDSHLDGLEPTDRARLEAVLDAIGGACPDLAWTIRHGMPHLARGARFVAAVQRKDRLTVHLDCDPIHAARVVAATPGATGGKTCVHFRRRTTIPLDLLRTIAAEILARP